VYTAENGKIYNSAVFIDRQGKKMGEYRKIYITEGEIANGVTPGPLQPPVFKTDFGIIGAQICFDVLYDDGWRKLRDLGAEIVFWPSAFGGGKMLNARCWQNNYTVVSSTRKNISKICDVSGEDIAATGYWNNNWVCAPVNLEKEVVRIWPAVNRFSEINEKYGRKVRITIADEEGWAVIESLSPEVFVADILKEFGLKTWGQTTNEAEIANIKARKD
jgi:predicted amidohydrolase